MENKYQMKASIKLIINNLPEWFFNEYSINNVILSEFQFLKRTLCYFVKCLTALISN